MRRIGCLLLGLTLVFTGRGSHAAEPAKRGVFDGKSVKDWIKQLKAKDSRSRAAACDALAALGPEAESAVSELTQTLKDEEDTVRRSAVYALADIGPAAKSAVPLLIDMLKNEEDADARGGDGAGTACAGGGDPAFASRRRRRRWTPSPQAPA